MSHVCYFLAAVWACVVACPDPGFDALGVVEVSFVTKEWGDLILSLKILHANLALLFKLI